MFVTWKTVRRVRPLIFAGHSVIESSTRVSQDEQTAAIAHCSATATRSSQRDYHHHHQPAEQSRWSGVRNLLFEASAVPTRLQYVDVSLSLAFVFLRKQF